MKSVVSMKCDDTTTSNFDHELTRALVWFLIVAEVSQHGKILHSFMPLIANDNSSYVNETVFTRD